MDHWRIPSFLQFPVLRPAPIPQGEGPFRYARPFDRISVGMHRNNVVVISCPGSLRSSVLLWKHLFLLSVAFFVDAENPNCGICVTYVYVGDTSFVFSVVRRIVEGFLSSGVFADLTVRGRHLFHHIYSIEFA